VKSFQALRFVFGTNATLATANYTVTVSICTTQANCDILENSIVTTLTGTCTASLGSPTTISCTNVNTVAISNNIIAARIWLINAGIWDTSQATGAFINDAGFGTYKIDQNTATTTNGVTTITVASVVSTTSSSGVYLGGFNEPAAVAASAGPPAVAAANTQILMNMNGNGPLIGYQDSTTYGVFKTLTDYIFYAAGPGGGSTMTIPDKMKLIGGVYGHTTGSAAAYNLLLVTSIDLTLLYATGAKTVFGGTTASKVDKFAGFDLFMNPNLWTINAAAGTKCIITNTPIQALIQPPASAPSTGDTTLHCYAITNSTAGASWTRVRTLHYTLYSIAGEAGPPIIAAATKNVLSVPATSKYWTYVWEGFVSLQNYSGACIKADTSVADYYGAFYTINSAAASYTAANVTATSSTVDAGELGSTAMTGGGSDGFFVKVFFSAPVFAPATASGTTFSGGYTNTSNKVWLSGYGDSAINSNSGLTLLRVRWTPATGDQMAPNGKIAIFYKVPASNIGLTTVAPTVASGTAGNTRCFAGGIIYVCNNERSGRALQTAAATPDPNIGINHVDMYQVFTSSVTWTTGTEFSLAFAAQPKTGYAVASTGYFRIGSVSASDSSKYWINGWDIAFGTPLLVTPSAGNAITTASNTACANGSSTLVPGVRMVSQSTDVVNTIITSGESFVVSHSGTPATVQTPGNKYGGFTFCT